MSLPGPFACPKDTPPTSPLSTVTRRLSFGVVVLLAAVVGTGVVVPAAADTIEFSTGFDSTLYQFDFPDVPYDDGDSKTGLKANGKGNYFGAGRSYSKNQIQRGLIQFDIPTGSLPPGAQVDGASLRLYIVDSPKNDSGTYDFWLIALPQFAQMWGEGDSVANVGSGGGGGSGADPLAGDATWYHTLYHGDDSDHHDPLLRPNSPWVYDSSQDGFWPEGSVASPADPTLTLTLGPGVLGDAPFLLPVGDAAALDVGPKGDYVTFTSPQMADDVQYWLDDPDNNFGWLVLGDESVVGNFSSKRGFASFQNATEAFRPVLVVEYSLSVPEPTTWTLGLIAALSGAVLLARRWR